MGILSDVFQEIQNKEIGLQKISIHIANEEKKTTFTVNTSMPTRVEGPKITPQDITMQDEIIITCKCAKAQSKLLAMITRGYTFFFNYYFDDKQNIFFKHTQQKNAKLNCRFNEHRVRKGVEISSASDTHRKITLNLTPCTAKYYGLINIVFSTSGYQFVAKFS